MRQLSLGALAALPLALAGCLHERLPPPLPPVEEYVIEREDLIAVDFPAQVRAVTGRGYMLGIGLHSDPAPYVAALRDQGLLCPSAGGNTIRMLPPLIATKADLDRATAALRAVFAAKRA